MSFPAFSFSEIMITLAPILISMLVFRRTVYESLNTAMVPGIFIVRIFSGVSFLLSGRLLSSTVPMGLQFRDGAVVDSTWAVVFALAILAVLISSVNGKTKSNLETYPQLKIESWNPRLIVANSATWAMYLFGYEYFFRGALILGYTGRMSFESLLFTNVLLYALAHAFKGWKEFLLSVPFGALLCYLCVQTNSFYPAFILHAVLALSNDWFGIRYQRSIKYNRDVQSYVLITGASAGIGKALAEQFAARGKNLLLVSLPNTGLEDVAELIRAKSNVMVHCYNADLTSPNAHAEICAWCKQNAFFVDTLVNNAGFGNLNPFEKTNASLLNNMMTLNNTAVVRLTHEFIPELKKFRQSFVMNVGSLASFMPIPNKSLYAATKSFIYTFSQSLFYELRPLNIHVCCLCPGGTLTERVRRELGEKKLNRTKFCQSPEEVAAIAVEAMYRKKFRIIPGWYNRVLFWLSQTLPDAVKIQIIELAFKREAPKGNSPAYLASRLKSIALITR